MDYDIFISYSRADTQVVNQFVAKLTDAGYRIWIDREGINGGEQFKTKIVRAIKASALVVFFSSAKSNASPWTVKEISYSLKKEKTIIPVKLDWADYAESIDFDLIDIDFIQYESQRPSSAFERLFKSIYTHIGNPQSPKDTSSPASNLAPDELFSRGVDRYNENDYQQAVYYFTLAAEQGNSAAQCNLGFCYKQGHGVTQNYNEAVKWYRKAAKQGNAIAQCNLGFCYMQGHGVTQNYKEAVKWYRKAAELGNAIAQSNLGFCYDNGHGVTQDYKEAVKWYRKAAEQGNAIAQLNLGVCYEYGQGIPKDIQKAIELYRKAAEQGNNSAIENLERLGMWN